MFENDKYFDDPSIDFDGLNLLDHNNEINTLGPIEVSGYYVRQWVKSS